MAQVNEGDRVTWKWGQGEASGKVKSVFVKKTTRTIKGSEITRNGTKVDSALYIGEENTDDVLKLASEAERE